MSVTPMTSSICDNHRALSHAFLGVINQLLAHISLAHLTVMGIAMSGGAMQRRVLRHPFADHHHVAVPGTSI
jgi:hypothetical protein